MCIRDRAYALQQFLKAEGHDVVDADYLPCVKEKLLNWAINRNSFDLFAGKARELFNRKKEHDDFGSSTADVFNRFLSQNIETTDRIVDVYKRQGPVLFRQEQDRVHNL